MTIQPGASDRPKSFDSQGFLITATNAPAATALAGGAIAAEGTSAEFMFPSAVPANAAPRATAIVARDLALVAVLELVAAMVIA